MSETGTGVERGLGKQQEKPKEAKAQDQTVDEATKAIGEKAGAAGGPPKGPKETPDTSRAAEVTAMLKTRPDQTGLLRVDTEKLLALRIIPPGQADTAFLTQLIELGVTVTSISPRDSAIYGLRLDNPSGKIISKAIKGSKTTELAGDVDWNGSTLVGGGIRALVGAGESEEKAANTTLDPFEVAPALREGLAPYTNDATRRFEKLKSGDNVHLLAVELDISHDSTSINSTYFQKRLSELAAQHELALAHQLDNIAIFADKNEKGGGIELFAKAIAELESEIGMVKSTSHTGPIEIYGETGKILIPNSTTATLMRNLANTEFGTHTTSRASLRLLQERDPSVTVEAEATDEPQLMLVNSIEDADILRALAPDIHIDNPTHQKVVDFIQNHPGETLIITGPAGIGKSSNIAAALRAHRKTNPETMIMASAGVNRNNLGEIYAANKALLDEISRTVAVFPETHREIGTKLVEAGLAKLQEFSQRQNDPSYAADLEDIAEKTAAIYDILAAHGFNVVGFPDDFLRFGGEAAKFVHRVRSKSKGMTLLVSHRSDIRASEEEVPAGETHMTAPLVFVQNFKPTSGTVNAWALNEINKAKGRTSSTAKAIPAYVITQILELAGANKNEDTKEMSAIPLRVRRVLALASELKVITVNEHGVCDLNQAKLAEHKEELQRAGEIGEITHDQLKTITERHKIGDFIGILLAFEGIKHDQIGVLPPEIKTAINHCVDANLAILQLSGTLNINPLYRRQLESFAALNPASTLKAKQIFLSLETAERQGQYAPDRLDPVAMFRLAEISAHTKVEEQSKLASDGISVALERGDYELAVKLAEFIDQEKRKTARQELQIAKAYVFAGVKPADAVKKLTQLLSDSSVNTETAQVLLQLEARNALLACGGKQAENLEEAIKNIEARGEGLMEKTALQREIYKLIARFFDAITDHNNINRIVLEGICDDIESKITEISATLSQATSGKEKNDLNSLLVLANSTLQRALLELTRLNDRGNTEEAIDTYRAVRHNPDGQQAEYCKRSVAAGIQAIAKIHQAKGLDTGGRIETQIFSNLVRATLLQGDANLKKTLEALEAHWTTCNDQEFVGFLISQVAPTLEEIWKDQNGTTPKEKALIREFHTLACQKTFEINEAQFNNAREELSNGAFIAAHNYAESLADLASDLSKSPGSPEVGGDIARTMNQTCTEIMAAIGIEDKRTLIEKAQTIISKLEMRATPTQQLHYGELVGLLAKRIRALR